MRRTIAAIAMTVVVGTAAVAGPVASSSAAPAQAAPLAPVEQITCGTLGDPVCALIDQLEAVLAPLAPVLAATAPLLGELGVALHSLAGLAEELPRQPAAEALETVRGALAQLGRVTKPVLGLLGVGRVDALSGVLTQLEAALVDQLAGPAEASPEVPTQAAAAAPGGAGVASPSLSSGRPAAPSTGAGGAPSVPSVPVGDELTLGPLGLPSLPGAANLLAAPSQSTTPVPDALPFVPAAAGEDDRAAGPAVAAAALLSGLLLALGLTLRARERQTESPATLS